MNVPTAKRKKKQQNIIPMFMEQHHKLKRRYIVAVVYHIYENNIIYNKIMRQRQCAIYIFK